MVKGPNAAMCARWILDAFDDQKWYIQIIFLPTCTFHIGVWLLIWTVLFFEKALVALITPNDISDLEYGPRLPSFLPSFRWKTYRSTWVITCSLVMHHKNHGAVSQRKKDQRKIAACHQDFERTPSCRVITLGRKQKCNKQKKEVFIFILFHEAPTDWFVWLVPQALVRRKSPFIHGR